MVLACIFWIECLHINVYADGVQKTPMAPNEEK